MNNMNATSDLSQQQQPTQLPQQGQTLQVDFSWMKFKVRITSKDEPQSEPLYLVDLKTFKPNLIFKSGTDELPFATGTLHAISIDADCEIRGQPIKIKALKRFKTEYMHPSRAYSDTDAPVQMTWTSDCDFKTWDFVCLDDHQRPVARFAANIWAVKKIGNIEFLGPKANSPAVRDEIVVTGLTLFYCMLLRTQNIFSLFGAMFATPGHVDKDVPPKNPLE